MNRTQFTITLIALLGIAAIFAALLPGGRLVAEQVISGAGWLLLGTIIFLLNLSAVIVVFMGSAILGGVLGANTNRIDSLINKNEWLNGWQIFVLFVFGGGLIIAIGAMFIIPLLIQASPWVLWLCKIPDQSFAGRYEIAPVGWGVFAWFSYAVFYGWARSLK